MPLEQLPSSLDQADQPTFEIQRLYIKEQSCKVPHAPQVFTDEWKPEMQLEMNIKHEKLLDDTYQVVLSLNATTKNAGKTAFMLDVQQVGIFKIQGLDATQLKWLLDGRCPGILFGYARKVVADATMEAGFPPVTLAPIDFEGMYAQKQANATKAEIKVQAKTETNITV